MDMRARQTWEERGARALWVTAIQLVGVLLGNIVTGGFIDNNPWLWVVVPVITLIAFFWQKSAKAEARLREIEGTSTQAPPAKPGPAPLENLQYLSNAELRVAVAEMATRLRDFDTLMHERQNAHFLERDLDRAEGKDPHERWAESSHRYMETSRLLRAEFEQRYRGDAVALRNEMHRRLGIVIRRDEPDSSSLLDHGMLAGGSPGADAAIYLEGLARRLPR